MMKRHPHGITVIICNKNFIFSKLSTLEAADNDWEKHSGFLGYKFEIYWDYTAKEIRQTFESIVTMRFAEFANHDPDISWYCT